MKVYLLKINPNQLSKLVSFLTVYSIITVLTFSEENLFDKIVFTFITDKGSGGVTQEEKERLIKENYGKQIVDIIDTKLFFS